MTPRLIGFTGLKGAGKDTAAATLPRFDWERVQMAGPLKAMLHALLDYAGVALPARREMLDGDQKEAAVYALAQRTPRHAMQTLGTEWGRACIADDIWIRLAVERIRQIHTRGVGATVTDVRFPNEAEMIHRLGGVLVRVERPGLTPAAHASESQVAALPADLVIVNDSPSAEAFKSKAWDQLLRVICA